jgi:secreted PhoX family phosphatase
VSRFRTPAPEFDAAAFERSDDERLSPALAPTLETVVARRMRRRDVLRAGLALPAASLLPPLVARAGGGAPPRFVEVDHGVDRTHHVAPDHEVQVLLRWGDAVLPGAPAFDPHGQSAAAQAAQLGYNSDYVAYLPLPAASRDSAHGLLCVNHEYTDAALMFPEPGRRGAPRGHERTAIEMAAHGGSVVEIERGDDGRWRAVAGRLNRRITASTPMRLAGPAAGSPRLRTARDPTGARVLGTANNCAGGVTPWGTWLMAEENFHGYFLGDAGAGPESASRRRYGVPGGWFGWARHQRRFDLAAEPNEPNRFGWVVEVDPYDPSSLPVKRTALGRFKHEGASCALNGDGRVAIYMGDDQAFEYLYRFVSAGRLDPVRPRRQRDLLDHGTLSVARFESDGTLHWRALRFGDGPLTQEHGFRSQADVLIDARHAADLLGATPMDRPEDVEPDPASGRVYVILTGNAHRGADAVDAANPRAGNPFGHILELVPPGGDHGAPVFRWEVLVRCGDPARPEVQARWNPATSPDGWFAAPDNAACDHRGNLWVATDQGRRWPVTGTADGLWLLETRGKGRGTGRMLFRGPVGAEICGPAFTPDDRSLFLAVQHPGAAGTEALPGFRRRSTFHDPATRWPDFRDGMPPRPSVVAIHRPDGDPVGG